MENGLHLNNPENRETSYQCDHISIPSTACCSGVAMFILLVVQHSTRTPDIDTRSIGDETPPRRGTEHWNVPKMSVRGAEQYPHCAHAGEENVSAESDGTSVRGGHTPKCVLRKRFIFHEPLIVKVSRRRHWQILPCIENSKDDAFL